MPNLFFQGFVIESDSYEAIDDEGFYDYGRTKTEVAYSITAITGGPSDTLRFLGGNEMYDGIIDLVKFPMTYLDQWTQSRNELINFELSVAAFGLSNTPGFRKRNQSQTREVVGYGELTIPQSDGSPSIPMDVLLVKVERTNVDSFFLGGAPAPETLLNAFGLIQGAIDDNLFYIFYKPDFPDRVLDIGMISNGSAGSAFYRPQSADGLTAVRDLQLADLNYFPNPVTAGQKVTLITENIIGSGTVSFMDLAGRSVFQASFESGFSNEIQIEIPSSIEAGMYMYQVIDQSNIAVGLGKLQVN